MTSYKERSDTAVKCLPDAKYKEHLKKLHSEMLNRISELEFYKENRTCTGCWGEIRHCDCNYESQPPKDKQGDL